MKYFFVFFFTFSFLFIGNSNAQSTPRDTSLRLVEKHDGTKYIAKIISDDGRELLLQTEALGKLYLPKSEVKRISKIEDVGEIKDGEFREESPFTTRYAFTNNALPIKQRNHYAMVNLFGPEIHFAVSDRLNLGIMTTWIGSPLIAVGKYTIPTDNEKVNFSIGTMLGTSGYLNQFRGFGGLHWGTFTYGDRKNNISFSAGFGYFNSGDNAFSYEPGVYVGDSNTFTYPDGSSYTSYNYPNIPVSEIPNLIKAPILSVAGIFQLTNKASLFFDSMLALGKSNRTQVTYSGGQYNYDPITGEPLPSSNYVATVTEPEQISAVALYVMPGMRFQKNENRAFQIALAGVSVWDNGNNYTFPLPTMSWFFKF
ncbi:MAG: hypothetical protein DBW72_00630 [Flavobacteriales bacterium]|nr:MAG: hypothetical protein DBW72_00630 [Flavobacteriales bacterium]